MRKGRAVSRPKTIRLLWSMSWSAHNIERSALLWGTEPGYGDQLGESQLVARLDIELMDLARGQLENAAGVKTNAGYAPRTQALPGPDDTQVLVERDHVDGEAHPHGVHAG